ncbi:putative inner membrane protein, partial [Escherichia coli TA280]
MTGNAIIKNSSVSIGYMGILGWGSAYFYGWGTSDYYEFPWWFVAVNHDDIARSLFYAFTIFLMFLVAWGTGFFLFLGMKRNTHIFELSFGRLYFSVFILFTPVLIELSVIRQEFWTHLFILLVILSLTLSVGVFICKRIFKDTINNLNAFIKRN